MNDALERHLERMRSEPVPLPTVTEATAQREMLVPRLSAFAERERQRRRRRRRGQRYGVAALAAVCLLSATWAYRQMRQITPAPLTAHLAVEPEPGPLRLHVNDRIVTRDSSAAIALESGTFIVLAEESTLRLEPDVEGELLDLAGGRISLDVPPLKAGHSLKVRTPQALITVHGTRFSVAVRSGEGLEGTSTDVTVDEGRVSVHSEGQTIFLTDGTSWSSAGAATPKRDAAPGPVAEPTPRHAANKGRRSDLGAENRLFAAALSAKRAGDTQRALEMFDQLIAQHPTSPLRSAAEAERSALRRASAEAPRR